MDLQEKKKEERRGKEEKEGRGKKEEGEGGGEREKGRKEGRKRERQRQRDRESERKRQKPSLRYILNTLCRSLDNKYIQNSVPSTEGSRRAEEQAQRRAE
jgi:hypothetical protein